VPHQAIVDGLYVLLFLSCESAECSGFFEPSEPFQPLSMDDWSERMAAEAEAQGWRVFWRRQDVLPQVRSQTLSNREDTELFNLICYGTCRPIPPPPRSANHCMSWKVRRASHIRSSAAGSRPLKAKSGLLSSCYSSACRQRQAMICLASQPPNPSVKGTSRKRAAPYVER
jgi:hypothetical protein